ncbi:MAG: ATP-binding protein [Planctomycetota bacterium]
MADSRVSFKKLCEPIIRSLPIGIIACDKDLRVIEANEKAYEMISIQESIDESLAAGTEAEIWGEWTEELRHSFTSGQAGQFDNVSYNLNGKTHLLFITFTPVKNTGSEGIIGGALVISDMTEKVNMEKELANIERLAAVGKLAAKVAHELNNPMDGILRYINLALRIVEQHRLEKPQNYLQQCRKGLMRMVQIIGELLEFSRSTYYSFDYVEADKIIDEAVYTMESQASQSGVQIVRNYGSALPAVRSGNLFQVFCNLTKNAIDAMPGGGKLTISARRSEDNMLIIQFHDTGHSFAPENREAIFEPFFTTKKQGRGTGLGLAICRDIIEKYKGKITAENAEHGGSIFSVYLPLADEKTLETADKGG